MSTGDRDTATMIDPAKNPTTRLLLQAESENPRLFLADIFNFKRSKKAKAKWKKRWILNVIGIHGLENPQSPPRIIGGLMWLAITIAKITIPRSVQEGFAWIKRAACVDLHTSGASNSMKL